MLRSQIILLLFRRSWVQKFGLAFMRTIFDSWIFPTDMSLKFRVQEKNSIVHINNDTSVDIPGYVKSNTVVLSSNPNTIIFCTLELYVFFICRLFTQFIESVKELVLCITNVPIVMYQFYVRNNLWFWVQTSSPVVFCILVCCCEFLLTVLAF